MACACVRSVSTSASTASSASRPPRSRGHLEIPLTFVPGRTARRWARRSTDLVWKLDLPFGDAVTGPQYLLGRAARAAGLTAVFNGEGGDQLFGGWTNKPMVAAERVRRPLRRRRRVARGALPAVVPPLLWTGGRAVHAGVSASGRRPRAAAGASAAVPRGRRRGELPRPCAAGRHRAERLAEHPAARRAHGERLGRSTCACRCSTARWRSLRSGCRRSSSCAAPPRSTCSSSSLQKAAAARRSCGAGSTACACRSPTGCSVRCTDAVEDLLGDAALAAARPVPSRVRGRPAPAASRAGRDAPAPPRREAVGAARCSRRGCASSSTGAAGVRGRRDELHPLRPRQQVEGPLPGNMPAAAAARSLSSRRNDPSRDQAFARAIDAVSGARAGALGRRAPLLRSFAGARRRGLGLAGSSLIAMALLVGVGDRWVRARLGLWVMCSRGVCVLFALGAALLARLAQDEAVPREQFDDYVAALARVHGMPQGVIVRRQDVGTAAPRGAEPDLAHYSFDRAVICDRARTVDLLLANNFHFENNCAVLSVDGYPRGVFDTVLAMLRRNPRLRILLCTTARTPAARWRASSPPTPMVPRADRSRRRLAAGACAQVAESDPGAKRGRPGTGHRPR